MGHVTRRKYNSYKRARMQFFVCLLITVYVHRLIYSIKMIALPFSEEAWQGDKILIYLFIEVSNEVTYLRLLKGYFGVRNPVNRALL